MITLRFSKSLLSELYDQIRVARQANDYRAYRVAQALIWYSEGKGFQSIAELLAVTSRSVYHWLRRLFCEGASFIERGFV